MHFGPEIPILPRAPPADDIAGPSLRRRIGLRRMGACRGIDALRGADSFPYSDDELAAAMGHWHRVPPTPLGHSDLIEPFNTITGAPFFSTRFDLLTSPFASPSSEINPLILGPSGPVAPTCFMRPVISGPTPQVDHVTADTDKKSRAANHCDRTVSSRNMRSIIHRWRALPTRCHNRRGVGLSRCKLINTFLGRGRAMQAHSSWVGLSKGGCRGSELAGQSGIHFGGWCKRSWSSHAILMAEDSADISSPLTSVSRFDTVRLSDGDAEDWKENGPLVDKDTDGGRIWLVRPMCATFDAVEAGFKTRSRRNSATRRLRAGNGRHLSGHRRAGRGYMPFIRQSISCGGDLTKMRQ